MENDTEIQEKKPFVSSKIKRILLATVIFLILISGYGFFYMITVGMMMWDSHNFNNGVAETIRCGSMPAIVPYYLIIFWPAVMFAGTIVPTILILKRVNPFIWIVLIFGGIFATFVVLTGWFGLIEFYCSGK
ncbi:MAG TPA: hypothetical protein PKD83_10180 [Ignavibacteria bacterium]|nr:hypothetical protein [Ignavibacteria bacterium]